MREKEQGCVRDSAGASPPLPPLMPLQRQAFYLTIASVRSRRLVIRMSSSDKISSALSYAQASKPC